MKPELESVLLCFTFILICVAENVKKPRKKRRWSVRPLNMKRLKIDFQTIFDEMKDDPEQFIKYVRMDKQTFADLSSKLEHRLLKKSKREIISPEYRLAITLHYMAQGSSMQEVAWDFYIGETTVSLIINETCKAIWDVLSPIYMKEPTKEELLMIADRFEKAWNLPHCIGALDGKHIHIQAPNKSGTLYFNYKKRFSLVLMAVCNADYVFTLVDIGAYGSTSDGGVFKECCFGKALENGSLILPPDSKLPRAISENIFPYFLAADAAFPLKKYIMRPYPGKYLNEKERIYNYRLSRGRRCIKNAFGILAGRWRIFRNDIIADVPTIENVTAAAVCLHNFLITSQKASSTSHYCPPTYPDTELPNGTIRNGDWRSEINNSWRDLGRTGSNNFAAPVADIRNRLADYFVNEGAVSWQQRSILEGSYPISNDASDNDSLNSENER